MTTMKDKINLSKATQEALRKTNIDIRLYLLEGKMLKLEVETNGELFSFGLTPEQAIKLGQTLIDHAAMVQG